MVETAVDNFTTRFVMLEGLNRPVFELETPLSRFVSKALEYGAHLMDKPLGYITTEYWERAVDILAINVFGKEPGKETLGKWFSHERIGEIYPSQGKPITRERVRQIVENTILLLHQNSPQFLQEQYPLDQLEYIIRRPQFMVEGEAPSRVVAEHLLQGATYGDLIKRGFPAYQLNNARSILAEHGLKVPYSPGWEKYLQLIPRIKALLPEDPSEEKERLLQDINHSFQVSYPQLYKTYCLTMLRLAKMAGLHFASQSGEQKLILQTLSQAGIPYKKIIWEGKSAKRGQLVAHIILAVDQENALAALENDQNLNTLRRDVVVQICGQRMDNIPTTWQLGATNQYRRVGGLLKKMGVGLGRNSGKTISDLLTGCSVPVFSLKRRQGYYYSISKEKQLVKFLEDRLKPNSKP